MVGLSGVGSNSISFYGIQLPMGDNKNHDMITDSILTEDYLIPLMSYKNYSGHHTNWYFDRELGKLVRLELESPSEQKSEYWVSTGGDCVAVLFTEPHDDYSLSVKDSIAVWSFE